jgi:hypothetical protein
MSAHKLAEYARTETTETMTADPIVSKEGKQFMRRVLI